MALLVFLYNTCLLLHSDTVTATLYLQLIDTVFVLSPQLPTISRIYSGASRVSVLMSAYGQAPLMASGESGVSGPSVRGPAVVARPLLNASATAPDLRIAVGTVLATGGGTNCVIQK